jgi:hypothetical protein
MIEATPERSVSTALRAAGLWVELIVEVVD